jgi:outer membrane protein assembly factor BamB
VVANGLVIITTNAGLAVAYEPETGKEVWKQNLDGPSTFGPIVYSGALAAIARSLYILDPASGKINQHVVWKSYRSGDAEATPHGMFVALRPPACSEPQPSIDSRIVLIKKSGSQRTVTTGGWPSFRRCAGTGLVYSSHTGGVDVFAPTNGALLFKVTGTAPRSRGSVALVDVKDGIIYLLTGSGQVYALRHP